MSIEKIKIESQQELEQLLTKDLNMIEKDLTLICNNIPVNDKTTVDVLCHDNNGQLVIVQMKVNEDDVMLLQGIQSLDYVDKFKSFLKATYSKHKIDDKEKPRLMLIAPSFSDALRRAVESMKGIRIDLFEWEYLKLGDHKGLRLQSIFAYTPPEKSVEKPTEKPKEEKQEEKKREPRTPKKKETEPKPEPMPEVKEEPAIEPPKQSEEPKKEEPQEPEPPQEKPKETWPSFSHKEEPQKKKLKLF